MTQRSSVLACLLLALAPAAPALAAAESPTAAASLPDDATAASPRQVMVMLRMVAPHVRAGTAYGGSYGDTTAQAARRRTAEAIARRHGLTIDASWPMPLLGVDCFVMNLPARAAADAVIAAIAAERQVAWAQPLHTYRAMAETRPDPLVPIEPVYAAWHIDELHRISNGRGVAVAVVDSRIDIAHPDLAGQFSTDRDFVGNGSGPPEAHGTGIAGVIGAKGGNGIGVTGVAPGARMMALRACWQTGRGAGASQTLCSSMTLGRAVEYAIEHGAKVINLSLSGPPDPLLRQLIDLALARHISVVAAIDPAARDGGFPSAVPGVVAVSDSAMHSQVSGSIVAPGRDIPTTQPGGKWSLVNGSSYSAAHVSGLIAMARQRAPAAPVRIARNRDGTVDACATLAGSGSCGCHCSPDGRIAAGSR